MTLKCNAATMITNSPNGLDTIKLKKDKIIKI